MRTIGPRSCLQPLIVILLLVGLGIPLANAISRAMPVTHVGAPSTSFLQEHPELLAPKRAPWAPPAMGAAPDTSPSSTDGKDYGSTVMSGMSTIHDDAMTLSKACDPDPDAAGCATGVAQFRGHAESLMALLQASSPPADYAVGDVDLRAGLQKITAACDAYGRWHTTHDIADADAFQQDVAEAVADMSHASIAFANGATYQ